LGVVSVCGAGLSICFFSVCASCRLCAELACLFSAKTCVSAEGSVWSWRVCFQPRPVCQLKVLCGVGACVFSQDLCVS